MDVVEQHGAEGSVGDALGERVERGPGVLVHLPPHVRHRIAPARAHGPVQKPGIQMMKAEMRRKRARNGPLARGGGSVDGDGKGHETRTPTC